MRNAREPSEETAKDTMVCTLRYCSSKAVRTATYGTRSDLRAAILILPSFAFSLSLAERAPRCVLND